MDQIEDQLSSEDPELEARLSRAPRYGALTKTVWLVTAAVIVLGVLLALADRML